ncbi:MAG TPA: VOC family protein [Bryobacteraceae bacterium]|jgi:PhnB protein
MKWTTPYLTFDGTCREAMAFYAACLGGELHSTNFADAPGNPPTPRTAERIMHARLSKDGVPFLMASDTMAGQHVQVGYNFSIAIECESVTEIDAMYAALSAGGQQTMPVADAFWGARFGMLLDKFGVQWMLNFDKPKA